MALTKLNNQSLSAVTSAGLPSGTVLQVVQAVKSDYFTTTSTSFIDIPSLTASITPISTSSKIIVDVHIGGYSSAVDSDVAFKIVRGSTDIGLGVAGQDIQATFAATANLSRGHPASMRYLDSPATTSATTYKVQVQKDNSGTLDINRRPSNFSSISTITLTEIAG